MTPEFALTPEFAQSLAEIRPTQTAHLLAWMADESPDPEPLRRALDNVREALEAIRQQDRVR